MKKFFISCLSVMLITGSFLLSQEITMQKITEKSDLPEGFCTAFEDGDYLVSDGKYLILIGGTSRNLQTVLNYPAGDAMGCIIGFVPAGKNLVGNVLLGAPIVRIDGERQEVPYSSIKPVSSQGAEGTSVIEAVAPYEGDDGAKAFITTQYRFLSQSGTIEIKSSIKNTGNSMIEDLSFSLYLSAMHSYSFSPFHWEKHADLNFRIYPKKGHFLGFLNQNPLNFDEGPIPGTLEPGESFGVQYVLLTDFDGGKLLQDLYETLDIPIEKAAIYFEAQDRDTTEIIIEDILSRSVFYRTFLEEPFSLEIPLPPGLYSVTANFFPAVVEELFLVEDGQENRCILNDPPHGTLTIKIQNRDGQYVPGRVTFIGLDPTRSPYVEPENPIESGRGWETYKNSCFPDEEGLEIKLPIGNYLIYASRGPEYTLETKIVEIFQDDSKELVFRIDKVVNTENLISVDPHMHTIYSDGRMDIAERIKSVVAEGVDVAVATDHNYINDYQPTLHKLGLNKYLATIVGNEVTKGGVIHYNTYPLLRRENEPNNGAINPRRETATPMFQDSRKKDPEALLQVNHPRSGRIGYFNNFALDPELASTADENLDLNFDVLEALNGPYFYSNNEQAITDWLNLMNRGYFFPIVASSDSHTIDGGQPGYSRTYVYYNGEKGDNLEISSLIRAMKKGHSFATNGPLVDLKINGTHIPGDSFTNRDGKVEIQIKVESAPWISVGEVRLIINGKRKIVFPVEYQDNPIMKFSGNISLPIEKDCYIAAEVLGDKSLFPVHQARARYGLQKNATLPYAVTNPIFIDTDGNGKFDPPLPKIIRSLEASVIEMRDGSVK
ncbi:MAG: PHP domain-containing protein [Candidatus Aminicenantes bacterium]|nr:MAG: PHP domain-containing protein [Candidatus Aminicenantes bacterium]